MKLVKGKSYLITGFKDKETKELLSQFKVKFPQHAIFNGEGLLLKDNQGENEEYSLNHFDLNKLSKPNTLEIYPYRGGFRYRKIAANGRILNHHYNTKQAASKGADAEARFWSNYKKVYK